MKSAGVGFLALALAGLAAGCSGALEQTAETRLECEVNGRAYFVSHPWACLRQGGRVAEVPAEPSPWISEAVKVGWQGRGDIKSGRAYYNRAGAEGGLRLTLPEVNDECQGSYVLQTPTDADWTATCDSGLRIEARLFLNEGGIAISAVGKDGEGRTFGFYPKAAEG